MTKILALIPARGGSKSIPRKNVLEIGGKPLIAYTIIHGLESNEINRVIVSTDDEEIAQISRKWGADVPFIRPSEYAQDDSPDFDVFKHALNWLKDNEAYEPDLVVHLRPTAPIRKVAALDEAIQAMKQSDADALRSVILAHQTPYKMWKVTDGYLTPLLTVEGIKESHSIGRQELPPVYWQTGYVDIIRPNTILKKNSMVGERLLPFIIKESVFDIDYFEDIPKIEEALSRLEKGLDPVSDRPKDYHPN